MTKITDWGFSLWELPDHLRRLRTELEALDPQQRIEAVREKAASIIEDIRKRPAAYHADAVEETRTWALNQMQRIEADYGSRLAAVEARLAEHRDLGRFGRLVNDAEKEAGWRRAERQLSAGVSLDRVLADASEAGDGGVLAALEAEMPSWIRASAGGDADERSVTEAIGRVLGQIAKATDPYLDERGRAWREMAGRLVQLEQHGSARLDYARKELAGRARPLDRIELAYKLDDVEHAPGLTPVEAP